MLKDSEQIHGFSSNLVPLLRKKCRVPNRPRTRSVYLAGWTSVVFRYLSLTRQASPPSTHREQSDQLGDWSGRLAGAIALGDFIASLTKGSRIEVALQYR